MLKIYYYSVIKFLLWFKQNLRI